VTGRPYVSSEREQNARLDQAMADARSGRASEPPKWTQRGELETFIRRSGLPGVQPLPEDPTAQSVSDEVWNRLGADGRVIDPADPDTVDQYSALVAQVEQERASEAFMHASTRDQLTASGIDVSDPSVRAAYGLDRR
jgi:hypothetical protein